MRARLDVISRDSTHMSSHYYTLYITTHITLLHALPPKGQQQVFVPWQHHMCEYCFHFMWQDTYFVTLLHVSHYYTHCYIHEIVRASLGVISRDTTHKFPHYYIYHNTSHMILLHTHCHTTHIISLHTQYHLRGSSSSLPRDSTMRARLGVISGRNVTL